ncbi:hypothetical protein B0H10DRAFT_2239666 [Mycena sp. CBHHK59/15]|nr:hypothetical protein B0H10DRAFT_2239666 [Mycena sp. CBHHK59/15]
MDEDSLPDDWTLTEGVLVGHIELGTSVRPGVWGYLTRFSLPCCHLPPSLVLGLCSSSIRHTLTRSTYRLSSCSPVFYGTKSDSRHGFGRPLPLRVVPRAAPSACDPRPSLTLARGRLASFSLPSALGLWHLAVLRHQVRLACSRGVSRCAASRFAALSLLPPPLDIPCTVHQHSRSRASVADKDGGVVG